MPAGPREFHRKSADFAAARHVQDGGVAGTLMSKTAKGDARAVAIQIARYLRAHPEAADTLEGAAYWWISPQPGLDVMERAMTMLEHAKVVERHLLPDGTVIFRGGRDLASSHDFSPAVFGA